MTPDPPAGPRRAARRSEPTQGLADRTRVAVTAGNPTPEELAAVLATLDAAWRADASARRPAPRPAWLRAARLEAVRGTLIAAPAELR